MHSGDCPSLSRILGKRLGREGFTLIELLVIVGIVVLLSGLSVAAIQQVREAARRTACANHMRQIGLALHAYHSAKEHFPPASSDEGANHFVFLLPFLEGQSMAGSDADPSQGYRGRAAISVLKCPSDGASLGREMATNYAGNIGAYPYPPGRDGFFLSIIRHILDNLHSYKPQGMRHPRLAITDYPSGLSNIVAVAEILPDAPASTFRGYREYPRLKDFETFRELCRSGRGGTLRHGNFGGWWWQPGNGETHYSHVLTPNRSNCVHRSTGRGIWTSASSHTGGVNVVMGDASTRFISSDVGDLVWSQLGSRLPLAFVD